MSRQNGIRPLVQIGRGRIANDHHIWVRKRERRLQEQTRFCGSTVIVKNGYRWGNLCTDNYFSKSYTVLQYSLHRLNYCCNAALCSLVEIRICTIAFLPSPFLSIYWSCHYAALQSELHDPASVIQPLSNRYRFNRYLTQSQWKIIIFYTMKLTCLCILEQCYLRDVNACYTYYITL